MGFFLLHVSSLSFEKIARREGASEEANLGETGRSNAKVCGKAARSWPAWDRNNSLGDPQKHHFISLISLITSSTNKQTNKTSVYLISQVSCITSLLGVVPLPALFWLADEISQ